MTALFVHGVPETTVVWEPLAARLDRDDIELLALPGFGCPLPPGFHATMDGYADWLATEVASRRDVDLVAHDWGGLLALKVLADRPPTVRSWVLDMGDLGDDFRWHDMAKLWQTPGEGERMMEGMVAASEADRTALLMATGVPDHGAGPMAAGFDETMAAAILTLYRSAVDIGTEWGPGIDAIEGPGLLVESVQDPFRAPERVRRLAERTGAAVLTLPDSGHWWMLDAPGVAAEAITAFWAGLD